MPMSLDDIYEKIKRWREERFDTNSEVRDNENPDCAISDLYYDKEEDRVYVEFEGVEE